MQDFGLISPEMIILPPHFSFWRRSSHLSVVFSAAGSDIIGPSALSIRRRPANGWQPNAKILGPHQTSSLIPSVEDMETK
jgi:hypothetical protein